MKFGVAPRVGDVRSPSREGTVTALFPPRLGRHGEHDDPTRAAPTHRVRLAEIFPPSGPPIAAERFEPRSDTPAHSHDLIELPTVTSGAATQVSAAGVWIVIR